MPSEVWLLGNPVSRSLSPAMQNAAFDAAGIDGRYVLREVDGAGLQKAIAELRADPRVLGANVTIPHKESVITLLDELDPLAARIGAVNTISRHNSGLKGWNTDIEGFRRALDECGHDVAGKAVMIIGAGGAARAVAAALKPVAAAILVVARKPLQARALWRDLALTQGRPLALDFLRDSIQAPDIIINATPSDLPPPQWLRPDQRIFDLRSRCSTEGRAMLLHQGAASFEIWTGRAAPLKEMRAALNAAAKAVAV